MQGMISNIELCYFLCDYSVNIIEKYDRIDRVEIIISRMTTVVKFNARRKGEGRCM